MGVLFTHGLTNNIIIHQTHYEKSDWSRAFNQFTIACELDMINAISAEILHLSCQVQRLPIVEKMYNKTIIEFGFRMIS